MATTASAPTMEAPRFDRVIVLDRLRGLTYNVSEDGEDLEQPTEAMFALWRAIRDIAAGAARCHPDDLGGIVDECADLVIDTIGQRLSKGGAA